MTIAPELDPRLVPFVDAALKNGFKVFAHINEHPISSTAGFVFLCLDTEGSFVTLGVPTHNWDDLDITAPVKPNKVWGSSVLVDYDGTVEDALHAMRAVCESPTVHPRFVGNVPPVPNYGRLCLDKWPGGNAMFVELTL